MIIGAKSLEDMVSHLKRPRRVMMLVKAGPAVDSFIEKLVPLLEKGDIIIDGGKFHIKFYHFYIAVDLHVYFIKNVT